MKTKQVLKNRWDFAQVTNNQREYQAEKGLFELPLSFWAAHRGMLVTIAFPDVGLIHLGLA